MPRTDRASEAARRVGGPDRRIQRRPVPHVRHAALARLPGAHVRTHERAARRTAAQSIPHRYAGGNVSWVVIVQFPSTTPVVIGPFADQANAESRAAEMNGM